MYIILHHHTCGYSKVLAMHACIYHYIFSMGESKSDKIMGKVWER